MMRRVVDSDDMLINLNMKEIEMKLLNEKEKEQG